MPFPPNDAQNAAIIARKAEGCSVQDIAREFGLSRQRVHAIIRRWGPEFEKVHDQRTGNRDAEGGPDDDYPF